MLWYLFKTWVGREKELVRMIRRTVPPEMYQECFVIEQERIWRKQQRSIVHMELLFPGCVFFTCKEKRFPLSFLEYLERIPDVAQWTSCGVLTIFPMMREDAEFLTGISGADHVVRLSSVKKDPDGRICRISDPLASCMGQIVRYQFKKRYAMVRRRLWGEEQAIVLGIMLEEDGERKCLVTTNGHTC